MLFTKFFKIIEARKRRRALRNIRREFAKAGHPLDHFRDSEIEAALTSGNDGIASVTLTAKTIYRALRRLQRFSAQAPEIHSTDAQMLTEGVTR